MKRSERIRQRINEIQNNIYHNLRGGSKNAVNKTYRLKKTLEPHYRNHADRGRQIVQDRVMRAIEGPKKRVVGKKK